MSEVKISFLGPIKRPPGVAATTTCSCDSTTTVGTLLGSLGYSQVDQSRLRVLVDGRPIGLSDNVGHVEELTIFLPLGGG